MNDNNGTREGRENLEIFYYKVPALPVKQCSVI